MARNMSFMLTTEQIRNKTKTVTRRLGWKNLKPGEIFNACVKCMGLKKGESVEVICQCRCVRNDTECLDKMRFVTDYGAVEAKREGFPDLDGPAFVAMFRKEMKCPQSQMVQRIEFEYVA